MTNWEKYFGTPERVAKTTVQRYGNPPRIAVDHCGRQVVDISKRRYRAWLQSGTGGQARGLKSSAGGR